MIDKQHGQFRIIRHDPQQSAVSSFLTPVKNLSAFGMDQYCPLLSSQKAEPHDRATMRQTAYGTQAVLAELHTQRNAELMKEGKSGAYATAQSSKRVERGGK